MAKYKIGKDKVYHLVAGFIISAVSTFLLNILLPLNLSCVIAFILTDTIGVAKEMYWDGEMGKGQVDIWDMRVTTTGALFGVLIMYIIL